MRYSLVRIKEFMTLAALDSKTRKRVNRLSERPIIIGGCPRSGTTLLISILSCHPDLQALMVESRGLHARFPNGLGSTLMPIRPWKVHRMLAADPPVETARRWCEKTPLNCLAYKHILKYFGRRVRILNIVRDGRDVALSRHPGINPHKPFMTVDEWTHYANLGREIEDHPQIMTVRYEDLIQSYEKTVKEICRFLDLKWHENFLAYPKTATVVEHTAWGSSASALSPEKVGKWRSTGKTEVIESVLKNPLAADLLRHYGYLNA